MTKKHFETLARELAIIRPCQHDAIQQYQAWTRCVSAVASACKVHNPAFNVERFKEACAK